jgi:hypothetical protein
MMMHFVKLFQESLQVHQDERVTDHQNLVLGLLGAIFSKIGSMIDDSTGEQLV